MYKLRHFKRQNNWLSRLKLKANSAISKPDYVLVGLFFGLIVFGLIMLSSASSVESYRRFGGTYAIIWRQISRGFLPGLILFYILSRFDYRRLEKKSVHFFFASLVMLILVFIPGIGESYDKAKSWINIFGIPFQPAEIVKLFLIFALAGWFSYRGKEQNKDFWNGLVPFSLVLGLISLLIVLQPDMGTLMVIAVIALAVYFVAGASLLHLFGLGLAGLAALAGLIVIAPYRMARLTIFLHPEVDPQGIGYHINQAMLAVGSGGIFGLGFGQSRQKFAYLPEVIGDSIFAIMAEELGFIFAVALVLAFLYLAWEGFKLYQKTDNDYGRYVVVGITSWFVFQAFFNIAAMIGLMPLTGIPLPFISYGGTSLAISMAAAGVLINISRQANQTK
ncbi:MAG: putative lipid II flippase FtsW [Candidatus Buchananbacteria bacterium]